MNLANFQTIVIENTDTYVLQFNRQNNMGE